MAGSLTFRSPSVCTGWLSRCILLLHLYLFLSSLRRAASFSCPPAVKPLPLVVLRRRRLLRRKCLLSAGASPPLCLLFPSWLPRRLSSHRYRRLLSSQQTRLLSRCRPLLFAACWPTGCTLTPPPLVLLMRRLCLLTRNLCLLTPRRLLSTGASPPVCLLFANWLLCCLSPRLRCFAPPFVTPPHVSILYPLMSCRLLHLLLATCSPPTGCRDAACGTSTVFVAPSLNAAAITGK